MRHLGMLGQGRDGARGVRAGHVRLQGRAQREDPSTTIRHGRIESDSYYSEYYTLQLFESRVPGSPPRGRPAGRVPSRTVPYN